MTPIVSIPTRYSPPTNTLPQDSEEESSFVLANASMAALLHTRSIGQVIINSIVALPKEPFLERKERHCESIESSDYGSTFHSVSSECSMKYSPSNEDGIFEEASLGSKDPFSERRKRHCLSIESSDYSTVSSSVYGDPSPNYLRANKNYISEDNTPELNELIKTQQILNLDIKQETSEIQEKMNRLLYIKVSTFKNPNIPFHQPKEEDMILINKLLETENKKKALLEFVGQNRHFPWDSIQFEGPAAEDSISRLEKALEHCKKIIIDLSLLEENLSPAQKILFHRYEDYKVLYPHTIY